MTLYVTLQSQKWNEKMWKQLWSHPRYYPRICLMVLTVTMKKIYLSGLFLGKDLNPGPPKFEPGLLPSDITFSVWILFLNSWSMCTRFYIHMVAEINNFKLFVFICHESSQQNIYRIQAKSLPNFHQRNLVVPKSSTYTSSAVLLLAQKVTNLVLSWFNICFLTSNHCSS